MKLYEIDRQIMDCIDTETGEIIDFDRLNELTMERGAKIEGIALAYKNYLAEADALKAEKDTFAERETRARSQADGLKNYLARTLQGERFTTARVDIGFRRSQAIIVDCDPSSLPDNLKKVRPAEPDKTAIKAAIKAGRSVPGCHIEERMNINIK